MAEYIEREKLNELLYRKAQEEGDDDISDDYLDGWQEGLSAAMLLVDDVPAADVRPERHGRWSCLTRTAVQRYAYSRA
ncbi:MAG: hypothetical protein NC299_11750, partial [Lachnospiraceae bacterium]|nr:hypothetical protein [Lachnospiraceae bacterium]